MIARSAAWLAPLALVAACSGAGSPQALPVGMSPSGATAAATSSAPPPDADLTWAGTVWTLEARHRLYTRCGIKPTKVDVVGACMCRTTCNKRFPAPPNGPVTMHFPFVGADDLTFDVGAEGWVGHCAYKLGDTSFSQVCEH